ncbi:MAG: aminotransferase class IV, partial [Parvularculaceae bacterium]
MTFWLNGQFREDTIAIDVADRGFLLGDGVFETLLLKYGEPVFLAAHLRRMRAGAAALRIDIQLDDNDMLAAIRELARRNNIVEGAGWARLTLSRGVGPRGLAIADGAWAATLLMTANSYEPPMTTKPAKLMVCNHRRNEHSVASHWKTLNYLDNILARDEALAAKADEAVMLNSARRVACASSANIFLIRGRTVVTPPLEEGAMAGCVRAILLEHGPSTGVEVRAEPVEMQELASAGVFITNSLIGLRAGMLRGARQ